MRVTRHIFWRFVRPDFKGRFFRENRMAEKKALTDESRFLRCSEIFQISDANCLGGREIQIEAYICVLNVRLKWLVRRRLCYLCFDFQSSHWLTGDLSKTEIPWHRPIERFISEGKSVKEIARSSSCTFLNQKIDGKEIQGRKRLSKSPFKEK